MAGDWVGMSGDGQDRNGGSLGVSLGRAHKTC